MNLISGAPLHLVIAAGLLALLVLSFLVFFLFPGVIHWFRLREIEARLAKFEGRTPPGDFRKLFAGDKRLAHLWKQYQDSLHVQREEREGQLVTVAVRGTLPAETFLNTQSVVDGRLRTEFFKHLPGIFTGIGIIGTFTGLIEGLRQFQVSENAATVRTSLEFLMHAVGEAFLISASAIAAAMVVTFIEKLLLASLYARTEEIAHAIDARFDGGAGEDYLQRLVKASEDSAVQSKTLKDALVRELGELLRELAAEQAVVAQEQHRAFLQRLEDASRVQAEAALAQSRALAAAVADSVEKGLGAPIREMTEAVKSANSEAHTAAQSTHNEQAVKAAQAMQEGLVRLGELVGARLDGSIERHIAGVGDLSRQSAGEMREAVQALHAAVSALGERVAGSQSESGHMVQSSLEAIGHQVTDMLAAIATTQQQAFAGQQAREETIAQRASGAVGSMSEVVEKALVRIGGASAEMAASVNALAQTTRTSIERLDSGAERVNAASQQFTAAGQRAADAMNAAGRVADRMNEVSGALGEASTAMRESLDDHRQHREAMGQLVASLRDTVELARKEASLTTDVLARIQASTDRLAQAQQQTDQYLSGVNHVLGEAHQAFAVAMKKTLDLANTEFHTRLSTAVGLLSSTIAEFEATLAHAPGSNAVGLRGDGEAAARS